MNKSILIILILLNISAFPVMSQVDTIQNVLSEIYRSDNYPGIVFSITRSDGTIETYTEGWADKEAKIEMTAEARLLSGSTGKTFVSAIVMQLLSEDKLDLNDHISIWLGDEPWFNSLPNHDLITLRDLLRHQSGLERYVFKPAFVRDVHLDPDRIWKPGELVSYILNEEPLFEPGKGFAYSDTNYILVGMIIEKIEGTDFYSSLQQRILTPLQLASVIPTNTRTIERLAQGYMEEKGPLGFDEKLLDNGISKYNLQFEWTGGGLAFETRDYARWLKLLFEGRAFDIDKVGEQYFDPVTSPEIGGEYGWGYQQMTLPDVGRGMGHSGFFPGYFTIGLYFPEHRIAVAMQVNTSEMDRLKSFFPDFMKMARVAIMQP